MKIFIQTVTMISVVAAVLLTGCKQSMVISEVDYSQSIESVLQPDENGTVEDIKHGLTFNIKPIQYAETQDTSSVTTKQVRYIRGQEGYYYITAPSYKNVYVMAPEKGKLVLKETLKVSDEGIEKPAFNQRMTHIQLLNRSTGEVWKVNAESIVKEESQMAQGEVN
ncbi:hypothetical protein [Fodinibius sp.]|uniref:hypothetical protein n=1 Tax=Fodinibius sp. TaxID=1872440 RepID=UPI002ACDF060|nr:hypothetical protein [Fodinibius sp.]MDZ7660207.1 hypothetical protein [Fodinibius sp.]